MRVPNAWSKEVVVGAREVEEAEEEEEEEAEEEEEEEEVEEEEEEEESQQAEEADTRRDGTVKLTRWYVRAFLSLVPATQTCDNLGKEEKKREREREREET